MKASPSAPRKSLGIKKGPVNASPNPCKLSHPVEYYLATRPRQVARSKPKINFILPGTKPKYYCAAFAFGWNRGVFRDSANSNPDRYASFRIFAIFSKLIFSTVSVTWW